MQPSHLFIQDPTMPPNPAPNPLTQLEEARRRLEEEEKRASKAPSRQRCVVPTASTWGGGPLCLGWPAAVLGVPAEAPCVREGALWFPARGGALVSLSVLRAQPHGPPSSQRPAWLSPRS